MEAGMHSPWVSRFLQEVVVEELSPSQSER